MTSWFLIISIVFIVSGILIFYLRKHNLAPAWLSNFLSPPSEQLVKSIESRTKQEHSKSVELQAVLKAKQDLMIVKAHNTKLRKGISEINEENANFIAKRCLSDQIKIES